VRHGSRSTFSIADESLFDLCEQVCGSLRRQVDHLDALLEPLGLPSR